MPSFIENMEAFFGVFFGGVLLLIVTIIVWGFVKRRRKRQDIQRLLSQNPSLRATTTPCGFGADQLVRTFEGLPRGDRRFGVEWGVAGPAVVTIGGHDLEAECAAFRWWWEVRRSDDEGHTTYNRRDAVAALARLPMTVPTPIVLRRESLLGRSGLTRGGQQLESSEFNRRFRVTSDDRMLTIKLLDASLQQVLMRDYQGRGIEFTGDLLLVTGTPTRRDALTGVVGYLQPARQDLARLVASVPAQFWRAVATQPDERSPTS